MTKILLLLFSLLFYFPPVLAALREKLQEASNQNTRLLNRFLCGTALCVCTLLAGPLCGTDLCFALLSDAPLYAANTVDLSLYFDDTEMVEVVSRYPKPLSKVTEQVTIITAEEIARSHAHTIEQILAEVPGLFIEFSSPDIGQVGNFNSLGSRNYHTLVLVDGVRQNLSSNGTPIINGLAPSMVKKIEIIKGPASSAWGSSLGGVINIITKDTGASTIPTGMLSATYGEGPSHGVNGEVLGKFAKLGYYFNVDHLDSDGLWKDRYTRKESFYGKLKLDLAHDIALGLSYSDSFPRYKALEWNADWSDNNKEYIRNHTRFGTLTLDAPLGDSFHLHAAANRFLLNFAMDDNYTAGLENTFGWEEDATEGSLRISWTGAQHSAVLGAETRRGSLDYANDWWQLPAWTNLSHDIASTVEEEQRGVYTNAALTFGDLTLSPGIRHDFNSNSGDTISPSFGAIYRLATHTNIRGTVARGFAAPYLWLLQNPDGGNRDLAQERIWNYQMGIETTYFKSVQLGAMAFHHVIKDAWFLDTASGNADPSNNGKVRRSGGELDIETLPWHQLTFKAAFSAASEDGINYENEEMYGANLTLLFDAPKFCRAKLNGRYVWWNKFTIGSEPGTYDDFVWDLVVDKEIMAKANYRAEVFMSVHNLFNATQSWDVDVAIPQRWVEGGLTLRF